MPLERQLDAQPIQHGVTLVHRDLCCRRKLTELHVQDDCQAGISRLPLLLTLFWLDCLQVLELLVETALQEPQESSSIAHMQVCAW